MFPPLNLTGEVELKKEEESEDDKTDIVKSQLFANEFLEKINQECRKEEEEMAKKIQDNVIEELSKESSLNPSEQLNEGQTPSVKYS